MSESASRARLGVIASVLSSTIFGVVFILSASLDFTGNVFFGWRIVFAVALLLGFLGVTRRLPVLRGLLRRLRGNPRLILALVVAAAMLGFQQWLFTWAPGDGRGLPLALGYLVMPIALALTGRLLFRERLGPWRIAAVSVAAVGVCYQVWQFGGLSWETLAVTLGYPIYFAVRRFARIEGGAGLTAEMILILPVALALLLIDDPTLATLRDPGSALSLSLFAVLGAGALALYIGASQVLPLSLFGMLSYLEPVLLIVAATVVLAEPLSAQELPTYAAIALALILLAGEGIRRRGPKTSL